MTGQIFEIKRFAVHDGDGIRTTVFFKGCPLRCVWCHNPEGLSVKPQLAYYAHKCLQCGACAGVCPSGAHAFSSSGHDLFGERCLGCGKCADVCLGDALTFYGEEITTQRLLPKLLEDRAFFENSGGGVTISGGECLLQPQFCAELLQKLKENGIHTAVDTCGFVAQDAFKLVMPYTDVFLYDIKAYDEDVHIRCTGQSNKLILENLKYLSDSGKDIEIRIPYVPGWNDDQMEKIAHYLAGLRNITKIRVLPYHNYAGSKYQALQMENTMPETLPTADEMDKVRAHIRSITGFPVGE